MNLFFTDLLNYLVPLAGATILCAAIACSAYFYQTALQKLPANVRAEVESLAETVVLAVEQKYRLIEPGSAIKKQDALNMLTSVCVDLDIPLDITYASAAIEAAVYAMNRAKNLQPEQKPGASTRMVSALVAPTVAEKPAQA